MSKKTTARKLLSVATCDNDDAAAANTHPSQPVHLGRLPTDWLSVSASSDVRGGATKKEFVTNLLKDGTEPWNKWFASGKLPVTVALHLSQAAQQKQQCGAGEGNFLLTGYALQTANDCPGRDPVEWDLIVGGRQRYEKEQQDLTVHVNSATEGCLPSMRFATKRFVFPPEIATALAEGFIVESVTLRITKVRTTDTYNGVQLGQFSLLQGAPAVAKCGVSNVARLGSKELEEFISTFRQAPGGTAGESETTAEAEVPRSLVPSRQESTTTVATAQKLNGRPYICEDLMREVFSYVPRVASHQPVLAAPKHYVLPRGFDPRWKHCPLVCKWWLGLTVQSGASANWSEVPRIGQTVSASSDVCGGGTRKEFVKNLLDDQANGWCKWYAVGRLPVTVTLNLDEDEKPSIEPLAGYALRTANDCPGRDPVEWDVILRYKDSSLEDSAKLQEKEAHVVCHASMPTSRFEWIVFDVPEEMQQIRFVESITLRITKVRSDLTGGSYNGVQLSQFIVFKRR